MSDIKKTFGLWRSFLKEGVLNEAMSDRQIKIETSGAKNSINLLVISKESADLALELVESSLKGYNDLKKLEIDSKEYVKLAKKMFDDDDPSTEEIDRCIREIENIRDLIKEKKKSL